VSIPISNASDVSLAANTGTLPNMESTMLDYFQAMTFETVVKTVVGFDVVETPTDVDFQGVWQPLSAQALMMKPEGQRAWKWFQVHAQVGLALQPDEVIKYQGVQYRVMARWDFAIYGYNLYHLVNDYTGAGPT
jgi:hypothetical protein